MAEPLVIIPARYGSTRLRAKALMRLAGKTLIRHTWEAATKAGHPVVVATDHASIFDEAQSFGGHVVMTGECANGTERCAEAARILKHDGPVVNWQGDSPLVPARWIRELLLAIEDGDAKVATPVQLCQPSQAQRVKDEARMGMAGATTVALSKDFEAFYFSKSPIPSRGPFYLHIGVYAYSADALASYGRSIGRLEQSEQLEQLRFIERGIPVLCVPVSGDPIWEVNNFDDLRIVEKMMEERNAASRA